MQILIILRLLYSWKENYEIIPPLKNHANMFCRICEALHNVNPAADMDEAIDNTPKITYPSIYHDMQKWWVSDAKCLEPLKNKQFSEFIRGYVL